MTMTALKVAKVT